MADKKKSYEKPKIREIKMLEVGAALCCRATFGSCPSSGAKTVKGQRTSTSS
jgi:hypothetical protein